MGRGAHTLRVAAPRPQRRIWNRCFRGHVCYYYYYYWLSLLRPDSTRARRSTAKACRWQGELSAPRAADHQQFTSSCELVLKRGSGMLDSHRTARAAAAQQAWTHCYHLIALELGGAQPRPVAGRASSVRPEQQIISSRHRHASSCSSVAACSPAIYTQGSEVRQVLAPLTAQKRSKLGQNRLLQCAFHTPPFLALTAALRDGHHRPARTGRGA